MNKHRYWASTSTRKTRPIYERALGSPICIVRGLLSATTDDEDPFALPLLRRDHGATKVKMVLQRPMAKPGWKLPPQTSALRTLGPYIDAMRRGSRRKHVAGHQ